MDGLKTINFLLNQPNTFNRNLEQIICLSQQFIANYENRDAIAGEMTKTDELRPMLATIGEPSAIIPVEADVIIATILKVLLRKSVNRLALGKIGMSAIIRSINRIQAEKENPAAAEMCNVSVNTCYDRVNAQFLIELDGVAPLIRFLKSSKDVLVIASALGALQGLCYVPSGRQYIRQDNLVKFFSFYYLSDF